MASSPDVRTSVCPPATSADPCTLLANESEVVEDVFRRYGSYIGAVAAKLVVGRHAVEDVRQETFARFILHVRRHGLESFDPPAALAAKKDGPSRDDRIRAFLRRTATRIAFDEIGRTSRLLQLTSARVDPNPGVDPERVARRNGLYLRVLETLSAMPEREALVVYLQVVGGVPDREIAEALGLSPKTASSLTSRAQAKFRKMFLKRYGRLSVGHETGGENDAAQAGEPGRHDGRRNGGRNGRKNRGKNDRRNGKGRGRGRGNGNGTGRGGGGGAVGGGGPSKGWDLLAAAEEIMKRFRPSHRRRQSRREVERWMTELSALLERDPSEYEADVETALSDLQARLDERIEEVLRKEEAEAAAYGQRPRHRRAFDRLREASGVEDAWNRLRETAVLGWARERPRLAVALAVIAGTVAFASAYAPVRTAIADALNIFRPTKIWGIRLTEDRKELYKKASEVIRQSYSNDEYTFWEQYATILSSIEEVRQHAEFPILIPDPLPQGAVRDSFSVIAGPRWECDIDWRKLRDGLKEIGAGDLGLPDLPPGHLSIDMGQWVTMIYRFPDESKSLGIFEMPSPTFVLPQGVDAEDLGTAYLRLLGVGARRARAMAGAIDFPSTLVLVPRLVPEKYRWVDVNGGKGMLFEQPPWVTEPGRPEGTVLWMRDGNVYWINAVGFTEEEVLAMARSAH